MVKTIIKEMFIMILLCAALVLVLAVVFYDYIPINRVVPTPISYTMPEELSDVKEELDKSLTTENEKVIVTYKIDESDLKGYKQTGSYNAGKLNPFEEYTEETPDANTTNVSQNTNTSTSTNTNSTGTFFEKPGTK